MIMSCRAQIEEGKGLLERRRWRRRWVMSESAVVIADTVVIRRMKVWINVVGRRCVVRDRIEVQPAIEVIRVGIIHVENGGRGRKWE